MMNDPWNSSAVENVLCEHPLFGTTGGFTGGFLADVTNAVSNSDNRSGANGKRGFGVSSAMTGGAAVTASAGGNANGGGGFVFDAKKPQSGSAALGGALFPPPPPPPQQQQQPSMPASITESPGRSTTPIDVATAILDDDGATPKQQKEGFYHTQHPVAVHARHTNLQQQQQQQQQQPQQQQQQPKKDVDDLVQQLNGRRPPPLSQRGDISVLDASKLQHQQQQQQQQQRVTPTLPTTSSPTSPFDAVASGAALPSPAFSVSTGIYPHQHHGIGGSARSSQAASQVSSPTWTTAAIQPQQQQQQPVVFARPQFHQHQQPQPTSPLGSSAASDSMSSGDSSSSKNTPTKMLDVAEGLHDEIRQVHQHLHHADRHPRLLCVVLEFKMENKMRFRCPPEIPIQTGQYVVVRFDSGGEDCGLVEAVYDSPSAMKRAAVRGVPHHDFGVVVRVATDDDCAIINDVLPAKEEEALAKAHQLVHFLHLPFTVVDAECQFDQKLMKVYYTLNPQSYTSNMPNVSRMHRELTFLLKMKVVIEQIKAPKWKR